MRAILLVHGLEAERRSDAGEGDDAETVIDLTARVTRVQARLDAVRSRADADGWLLAVYDAALAELCDAVGVGHFLAADGVCPETERQRVELVLLSSVLPLE